MVADLKESNPSKWYSKVKRMCGQSDRNLIISVDELTGLSDQEQAERIARHYSQISNQYEQVRGAVITKNVPKLWKSPKSALKIKKSTIQNVDYFETRRGVWIFKYFPNSND